MCPFSHRLKQTVKERERKMKRNDSKKVDRLVHPLCQHLLVYRSSALYCFFTAVFLLSGKVWSTASTEALQHRAAAHSRLLHWHRALSVCLSVHPLHKLICHPAYTTVPFLTLQLCVSVHVFVWVCVSTCMCVSQSYKFLTLQKMFLFSVP